MCRRFALAPHEDLSERYGLKSAPAVEPRYNIAPQQNILVITPDREAVYMKWGLIMPGREIINARVETVTEKRMFSYLLDKNRCLIPTTGFYEWDENKRPYFFTINEGELFSMPGIFEDRKAVLLTQEATSPVNRVHNRMPCILEKNEETVWLKGAKERALEVVHRTPELSYRPIGHAVNDLSAEGPDLIRALDTLDDY